MSEQRRQAWYEIEGAEHPVLLEVVRLYKAGLSSLDARPLDLPLMSQAATLLRGISPRERQYRLITALLDSLLDPDSDQWIAGALHRQAASLMLGLDDSTHGDTHRARREQGAKLYHQHIDVFRQPARKGEEAPLLRRIVDAIERILAEYSGASNEAPRENSRLIDRPEYEAVLALAQGYEKPVIIWGEPGTGKSTLTRQVALQVIDETGQVITLNAESEERLDADILDALIGEGMEPTNWTPAYRRAAFKRRISRSGERSRFRCVIIDGIEDLSLLQHVTPPDLDVAILVTTRARPQDSSYAAVELLDFNQGQAGEFIRRELGAATDNEILALGCAIGYRPLALDHAVRLIKQTPGLTIDSLAEALTKNVTQGLELMEEGVPINERLTTLYALTLDNLAGQGDVLQVLDAFLAITGRNGTVVRTLLQAFLASPRGGSIDYFTFKSSLRKLMAYGLIRVGNHRDPLLGKLPCLSMPPLAVAILRELRPEIRATLEEEYFYLLHVDEPLLRLPVHKQAIGGSMIIFIHHFTSKYLNLREMPDGWLSIYALDGMTMMGLHSLPGEAAGRKAYLARYEFHAHGIYRLDYRNGVRSLLNASETDDLRKAVECHVDANEHLRKVLRSTVGETFVSNNIDSMMWQFS